MTTASMTLASTTTCTTTIDGSSFLSDTYRGCPIALLERHRGWMVYLDMVLQQDKLFVSADAATTWLKREIDARSACDTGQRLPC